MQIDVLKKQNCNFWTSDWFYRVLQPTIYVPCIFFWKNSVFQKTFFMGEIILWYVSLYNNF